MSTTVQKTALDPTVLSSLAIRAGHFLDIRFADDLTVELDLSAFVGAAKPGTLRQSLRDPVYFAQACIDHGVITWPNGYDIAPETLRAWAEQGRVDVG